MGIQRQCSRWCARRPRRGEIAARGSLVSDSRNRLCDSFWPSHLNRGAKLYQPHSCTFEAVKKRTHRPDGGCESSIRGQNCCEKYAEKAKISQRFGGTLSNVKLTSPGCCSFVDTQKWATHNGGYGAKVGQTSSHHPCTGADPRMFGGPGRLDGL